MQASDLVASALSLTGSLPAGETPQPEEAARGFEVLNALIDGWNVEGIIYSVVATDVPLLAGTTEYVLGAGGVFGTVRPLMIRAANCRHASGISGPVEVVDATKFSGIQDKSETSQLVRMLFCDYAYPAANLSVWPKPAAPVTLTIRAFYPLRQFAASSDVVDMPPGYLKALRYNLARDLANEFGFPCPPDVKEIAAETKAALKATTAATLAQSTPAA